MKTRTAKELRHLMPAFYVASLAAVLLLWSWTWEFVAAALFVVACAVMAAETFGVEFRHGTIALLLTEPIARSALWHEKMRRLALMLVVSTTFFTAPFLREHLLAGRSFRPETWIFLIALMFIPICAFCAGPFWTLLFRNTLVGTIVSLLVPAGIVGVNQIIDGLVRAHGERCADNPWPVSLSAFALLAAYSLSAYWLGYSRFKAFEVVNSYAKDLHLPAALETPIVGPLRALFSRHKGPIATLVRKEIRLQQVAFGCAGLFLGLTIAAAILHTFKITSRDGTNIAEPVLAGILCLYVSLIPFLVGAVAVTDERAWGLAEWHMTLTPSIRKQWLTKLLMALSMSLILGMMLPAALIIAGRAALLQGSPTVPLFFTKLSFLKLACLASAHMLVTSIVIYGACFCRNTIAAILLSGGMILVAWTVSGRLMSALGFFGRVFNSEQGLTARTGLWVSIAAMLLLIYVVNRFAFVVYRAQARPAQLVRHGIILVTLLCLLTVFVVLATSIHL